MRPHGLQYARLLCPSPTPGTFSNSYPLHWRCHPTISSCFPLLLPPLIFPSIRVFSSESVLRIRWPKYWSFSISPSNEYTGLIYFRMDWLDPLAVQGILKSLLQHHSSKASILLGSTFFKVQLSHPYMTTGKIIALARLTFVGKGMSLLFNILSRLVITCLPEKPVPVVLASGLALRSRAFGVDRPPGLLRFKAPFQLFLPLPTVLFSRSPWTLWTPAFRPPHASRSFPASRLLCEVLFCFPHFNLIRSTRLFRLAIVVHTTPPPPPP